MAFSAHKMGLVLEGAGRWGWLPSGRPDRFPWRRSETVVILSGGTSLPRCSTRCSILTSLWATSRSISMSRPRPTAASHRRFGQPALAWHLGVVRRWWRRYQVATFDNRRRPSSSPPFPYSVEGMTKDALSLLDHLGWTDPSRRRSFARRLDRRDVGPRSSGPRAVGGAHGSANKPTAWEIAITTVERTWPVSMSICLLVLCHPDARYLPIADIQNDEVVSTWLSFTADLPVWPNPAVSANTSGVDLVDRSRAHHAMARDRGAVPHPRLRARCGLPPEKARLPPRSFRGVSTGDRRLGTHRHRDACRRSGGPSRRVLRPSLTHTGCMESDALDDALTVLLAPARVRSARFVEPRSDGREVLGTSATTSHRGLGDGVRRAIGCRAASG